LDPQDWLTQIKVHAPLQDNNQPALRIHVESEAGATDIAKIAAETLLSALEKHHRFGVDDFPELTHLQKFSYDRLALGKINIFLYVYDSLCEGYISDITISVPVIERLGLVLLEPRTNEL